jgi:hypothetical protein
VLFLITSRFLPKVYQPSTYHLCNWKLRPQETFLVVFRHLDGAKFLLSYDTDLHPCDFQRIDGIMYFLSEQHDEEES